MHPRVVHAVDCFTRAARTVAILLLPAFILPAARAQEPAAADEAPRFDDVLARVSARLEERQRLAAEELNRTRERIAAEKAPWLARLRAAEDRVLAATAEARRLRVRQETAANERRRLLQELDGTRKAAAFATTLARDSLDALHDGLSPGEPAAAGEAIRGLLDRLGDSTTPPPPGVSLEAVELMFGRIESSLGGYAVRGEAVQAGTNRILPGQFAFAGPEVFFRSDDGVEAGSVRAREGSGHPVVYPAPAWRAEAAARYFAGQDAAIPADASGGKALRLEQTRGTLREHIDKGGVMAYVILAVGFLALLMVAQKIRDVSGMRTMDTQALEAFLAMVARGDHEEAQRIAAGFRGPSRELFAAGMRHRLDRKEILEEHLEAVLLEQRLHFERRLPLLAVIATAAPLMGLLGTVVGMVKTFALITVFGTGNAGKLSSGISEVLVATELGLAVAIPTLIAHGFLAHRIEKNLAQLERHALKFVIAVESSRGRAGTAHTTGTTPPTLLAT